MSYPAHMEESVRKVEATRERRLTEELPRIPIDERILVLKEFHPDFIEAGMRELLVGPNKGDRTPNELADLLEGNSRIDSDKNEGGVVCRERFPLYICEEERVKQSFSWRRIYLQIL